MKRTILLVSAILLLAANSCIKKNTDNSQYNYNHRDYFSAVFDNYFSTGETGLMIFLSDMSGNLLAEANIEGKTSVYLTPKAGTLFPELIIETLVYKGPETGGKSIVYLYSYLQVLPASWIWTTFESNNIGQASLEFSAIPTQTAYGISSNFDWIHGDVIPSYITISLGKNPDNIYILLNTVTTGTGINGSPISQMRIPIRSIFPPRFRHFVKPSLFRLRQTSPTAYRVTFLPVNMLEDYTPWIMATRPEPLPIQSLCITPKPYFPISSFTSIRWIHPTPINSGTNMISGRFLTGSIT